MSTAHLSRRHLLALGAGTVSLPALAQSAEAQSPKDQVMATERAFAKTMADRDLKRFASFVADDTVFFSGPTPLRGKAAVVAFWQRFYEKPEAPFSWEPDQVEVLDSGLLALSTGPVRDPQGQVFARFNSIWRREAPGVWRIVFDKGERVCAPTSPAAG
jgi:ketosteroid isomerase-like protein